MKTILLCLFFAILNTAFAWGLKTGTYDMYGVNANGSTYQGQVVITPQGDNYNVVWLVGNNQAQVGVGIFNSWEDILSVAYTDITRTQWGVVSYKVGSFGEIKGKWTTYEGTRQATETLTWRNSYTY